MPAPDRRQGRTIPHIFPKKKLVTVQDILASDDVNSILHDLEKIKSNITDMIVCYVDKRDNKLYFQSTEDTLESLLVWMLENAKITMLTEDTEND